MLLNVTVGKAKCQLPLSLTRQELLNFCPLSQEDPPHHAHDPIQSTLDHESKGPRNQRRDEHAHGTPPRKTNARLVQRNLIPPVRGNDVADFVEKHQTRYTLDVVFLHEILSPLSHGLVRRQSQPIHLGEVLPERVDCTTARYPHDFECVLLAHTCIHLVVEVDQVGGKLTAGTTPVL